MAKVKLTNLDEALKKVKVAVVDIAKEPKMLVAVGKYVRDRIFKTTKAGNTMGFNTSRPLKLLSLKALTIKLRRWHQKAGLPVGQGFGPAKSNLTYTGQMLDALDFEGKPSSKRTRIFVKPTVRNREGTGLRTKDKPTRRLTNLDVAKQVTEDGRPFIGLDDIGKKGVVNIVRKAIREEIRKNRLSK